MAEITFPQNPTLGQIHNQNGRTWRWDGNSWNSIINENYGQFLYNKDGYANTTNAIFVASNGSVIIANTVIGGGSSSGYSGTSGYSGYSGTSGYSGYSGIGTSGYSGYSGPEGQIDVVDAVPPTPLYEGQIWFDSSRAKTFVYYDSFWVEIGSTEAGLIYQRQTFSANTSSLANNASENINITAFKSYVVMSVYSSQAAWIRLYSDTASRTADESRPIDTDPTYGSGVLTEIITTGPGTQKLTPFVVGGNLEAIPPDDEIYLRITNLSGSTNVINIQLTLVRMET